jgi:hypothetical protein
LKLTEERKGPLTKKRISRRQLFKMAGNLGKGQVVEVKQEHPALVGTVKYPWGTVAGATITVADRSVTSDSAGKYQIAGLAPGSYTATLKAPFPGYEAPPKSVTVAAGETSVLDFDLDYEKTLVHGYVYDPGDKPITGATLSGVMCGNDVVSVVTDDKGYFKFENARPGYQFLRINALAYVAQTRDLDVKKGDENKLEFRLTPASCHIHGSIQDVNNRPLSAEITLSSASGIVLEKTRSNAETGYYDFPVQQGVYGLLVTAPECQPKGWRGQISSDQNLDFKLDPNIVGRFSPENPSYESSAFRESTGFP